MAAPIILLWRRFPHKIPLKFRYPPNRSLSTVTNTDNDYSETPEYPPITDLSPIGKTWSKHEASHEKIKMLPTVEEKLLEMSRTQKRMFIVESLPFHSNSLPLRLYATKTNLIHGLPAEYSLSGDAELDAAYEKVKPRLLAAIRNHYGGEAPLLPTSSPSLSDDGAREDDDRKEGFLATRMFDEIFRVIITEFSEKYQHLRGNQIDYNPRVEAFWLRYGFHPSKTMVDFRKRINKASPHLKWDPDELLEQNMQYVGSPMMLIRSRSPLPQFVDLTNPVCASSNIANYPYSPRAFGHRYEFRYPTSVAGVWPSAPGKFDFGHLTVHTHRKMRMLKRRVRDIDEEEVLHSLGLTTSFGTLLSLATYKGFTPFHELTYPVTTQTIVTDGITWTFFTYQLNSICLGRYVRSNDNCNVCWATKPARLFESVSGGQIVGLNEDVLKTVLKFVLKKPVPIPEGVELRPHLGQRSLAAEEWNATVTELRKLYTNKPPFSYKETFLWEKIYKKWFQSRITR